MDIKDIHELLKFVSKSSLTDVEIEQKDFRLRIQRKPESVVYTTPLQVQQPVTQQQVPASENPANPQQVAATPAVEPPVGGGKNLKEFKAPFIGTFYRSSSPDKDAFVKVGDTIRNGQVLGIIEAMKLFNEIESDVEGKIVKILVENAQPVEYDQPLFLIEVN